MDSILQYAPLIKLLFAFTIMLAAVRFKLGLGASILLGALSLAPLFGMAPTAWLQAAWSGLINEKTLFLASIVGLILVLSDVLDKTGQAKRFMEALSGYLRKPRLALIFFPALIGLLPMPGGAVFSAPMVKNISQRVLQERNTTGTISPRDQAVINYWFRHVWELAWPLYPGLILTASLADVPLSTIVLYSWPGPVVVFLLGWFFILRPLKTVLSEEESEGPLKPPFDAVGELPPKQPVQALRHGLPLLIAIAGALGLEALIASLFPKVPYEAGIVLALVLGITCCLLQNRDFFTSPYQLTRILFTKHLAKMLLVVVAIFVFKEVLQQANVVHTLAIGTGDKAALLVAAIVLPYVVGLITGIMIGYVGPTFPLLIGLVLDSGLQSQLIPWLILGLFSGFAGQMTSPLHVCFILTCQYFRVDLGQAWKKIFLPGLLLLGFGILYFFVLTSF